LSKAYKCQSLSSKDWIETIIMERESMGKTKRVKRDCRNYTLRNGRKVVKYGISCRPPKQRETEMKVGGLDFTSMTVGIALSEKTARKREKENIKGYQRGHRGRKPKYNK